MTNKTVITGPGVPKGLLPFSPAVQVGNYIFLSGQASVDGQGNIIPGSFEEECRRSFEHLKRILEIAGLGLEDIVQVRAYVGRKEDLPSFNKIYKELFTEPYPARTTLIGCLGDLLKFEVDAIALGKNS